MLTDAPVATARLTAPPATTGRKLRLAYLTNQYPAVSHTFIRREILELERRGHSVLRLAIRRSESRLVDEVDRREDARTRRCLDAPAVSLLWALAVQGARRPLGMMRAIGHAIAIGRSGEAGLLKAMVYLAEAAYLVGVARRERIEHLHVHFGTNPAAVARLMRRLGGPPFSVMIHGPLEFDSPRGWRLGDTVRDAAFVAAISDYCSAQLKRWVPMEHWRQIHVVRCAVDETFFDEATPVDPGSRTLLCVGRLAQDKAQPLLLEAFAAVVAEGIDATLVLAGGGELQAPLERRARELGIADRVAIAGSVDGASVRRLISQSRALVLTSFAEGLPVVIMEALAMGRPVLSTYIAGIPELVRPGDNGWLIPAGSIDAIVGALREVLATPGPRLREMGENGRALVRERHLAATEAARLERLFLNADQADKSVPP